MGTIFPEAVFKSLLCHFKTSVITIRLPILPDANTLSVYLKSHVHTRTFKRWSIGWLLEFYILATSKVKQRRIQTCDCTHDDDFIVLRNLATSTMTWYSTQSPYPDTELISRCPILLIVSAKFRNNFLKMALYMYTVYVHTYIHTFF